MLKIGDKAPDFKAVDGDGRTVALSDYKGKKLVIYFYPKDNTPGCTAEACDLRDNYHRFQAAGYEILGVSKDSEKSHRGSQKNIHSRSVWWPIPIRQYSRHTMHGAKRVYTARNIWGP